MTVAELVEMLETTMQQSSSEVVVALGAHRFNIVKVERSGEASWTSLGMTENAGELTLRVREIE